VRSDEFNLEIFQNLSIEEYLEKYYDLVIKEQSKPENFIVPKYLSEEIFKKLVQEYYDVSYTENIIIEEYKEYYIIRGKKNNKKIDALNRIEFSNSAVVLILRIKDGTVISFYMES
jgi:adenosine deaminase